MFMEGIVANSWLTSDGTGLFIWSEEPRVNDEGDWEADGFNTDEVTIQLDAEAAELQLDIIGVEFPNEDEVIPIRCVADMQDDSYTVHTFTHEEE